MNNFEQFHKRVPARELDAELEAFTHDWWKLIQAVPMRDDSGVLEWHLFFRRETDGAANTGGG